MNITSKSHHVIWRFFYTSVSRLPSSSYFLELRISDHRISILPNNITQPQSQMIDISLIKIIAGLIGQALTEVQA